MENKKTDSRKILVLIDAHAVLHRAYHALPNFTGPGGEPTGAIYGFINFIYKVAKDLKPDYLAACYDLPGGTFRHKAFKEYKAKRPKIDDALSEQIEISRAALKALNIPVYDSPGFEADDMLGTIVEQVSKNFKLLVVPRSSDEAGKIKNYDLKIIIASGDMDTMQLVDDDRIVVYTLKQGINETVFYDEDAIIARYGFAPRFIPDFKGLKGDPSDNIPGVPGIGDKTATEILKKYGSLEKMYKTLREARQSKSDSAKATSGKASKARVLSKKSLNGSTKSHHKQADFPASERIIKLLIEHEEEALFSKSLATIRKDAPIEFSLEAARWPHGIDREGIEKIFTKYGLRSLSARLSSVIGNAQKNEISQNEDETKAEKEAPTLFADSFPKTTQASGASKLETILASLRDKFGDTVPEKFLREVELPLDGILKEMARHGVLIDTEYLKELSAESHKKIKKLEKKIYEIADAEFNINSPKQLGEILFEKLYIGEGKIKMTPSGSFSTDSSQLLKFKDEHKIIPLVIEYREIAKLVSTYIDAFPKMVDSGNRLHATFDSAGAATGRLSSSNPNLQNIPIRSELGTRIRRAFIAPKGKEFLALDYSQIELRILAILSRDQKLKEVFRRGEDVHTVVASEVFEVNPKDITPEMRRRAKVINFGIIYGMGVNALKISIGCTQKEAKIFYDNYFKRFPTIKDYLENIRREAFEKGYTETLFGRKRYFPDIRSRIPYLRASAERMAVNAPIQGSAADFIKLAMVNIDEALKKNKLKSNVSLILQIHDELVYEVDKNYLTQAAKIIVKEMEGVWDGEVPVRAHVEHGVNLAELESF